MDWSTCPKAWPVWKDLIFDGLHVEIGFGQQNAARQLSLLSCRPKAWGAHFRATDL